MIKCQYCGHENIDETFYCGNCSKQIKVIPKDAGPPREWAPDMRSEETKRKEAWFGEGGIMDFLIWGPYWSGREVFWRWMLIKLAFYIVIISIAIIMILWATSMMRI